MKNEKLKKLINDDFNKIISDNYSKIKKEIENINFAENDLQINNHQIIFRRNYKSVILTLLFAFFLLSSIIVPVTVDKNLNSYTYSLLEINPSVAIISDKEGNVVNIVPKNAEGAVLVRHIIKEETDIKEYKLDEAVVLLTNGACQLNYIHDNDINFSFYSNNSLRNKKMKKRIETKVENVLANIKQMDFFVNSKLRFKNKNISEIDYEKSLDREKSFDNLNKYVEKGNYKNKFNSNDSEIKNDVIKILRKESDIKNEIFEYGDIDKLNKAIYSSKTYFLVYKEYGNGKNYLFKSLISNVLNAYALDKTILENKTALQSVIDENFLAIKEDTQIHNLKKEDLSEKVLNEKSLGYIKAIKEKFGINFENTYSFKDLVNYTMNRVSNYLDKLLQNVASQTSVDQSVYNIDDEVLQVVTFTQDEKYKSAFNWLLNNEETKELKYYDYIDLKLNSKLQNY